MKEQLLLLQLQECNEQLESNVILIKFSSPLSETRRKGEKLMHR